VAARFDLTASHAYDKLVAYGKPSLQDQIRAGYARGYSVAGEGLARESLLMKLIESPAGHCRVILTDEERERFLTWIDAYAQRLGHFSDEQERELVALRNLCSGMLAERPTRISAGLSR
jgi:hypothetical protein